MSYTYINDSLESRLDSMLIGHFFLVRDGIFNAGDCKKLVLSLEMDYVRAKLNRNLPATLHHRIPAITQVIWELRDTLLGGRPFSAEEIGQAAGLVQLLAVHGDQAYWNDVAVRGILRRQGAQFLGFHIGEL